MLEAGRMLEENPQRRGKMITSSREKSGKNKKKKLHETKKKKKKKKKKTTIGGFAFKTRENFTIVNETDDKTHSRSYANKFSTWLS